MQYETKHIIAAYNLTKMQLLSAGVVSRRELIIDCLKANVPVQLAVQNPHYSVSRSQEISAIKALHDICEQIESDGIAEGLLQIKMYDDHASVRLTILEDLNDKYYIILGWYTYMSNSSTIHGSPHPSLLVSGHDEKPILRFATKEFKQKWDSGTVLSCENIRNMHANLDQNS